MEIREQQVNGKEAWVIINSKHFKRCPKDMCDCPCVCGKGGKGGKGGKKGKKGSHGKKKGGSGGKKKGGGSGGKKKGSHAE